MECSNGMSRTLHSLLLVHLIRPFPRRKSGVRIHLMLRGAFPTHILSTVSLKEVQEYPEDFDGVVVGSPANRFTHLSGWLLHLNQVSLVGSPRYISASQWSDVVAPEVMKQCDALDGVRVYSSPKCFPQLMTL